MEDGWAGHSIRRRVKFTPLAGPRVWRKGPTADEPSATQPPARRRRENRLALNFFNVHATIMSQLSKNQKPTVGFQARFFLEGSEPCKFLIINGVRDNRPRKSEKTRPQTSFFPARPPRFSAKTPKKRAFFAVSTFLRARPWPS
jgi:hypothetical protein